MQQPPPPRWRPVQQRPWMQPLVRPAFVPPLPRGFPGPPRFLPHPPRPFYPSFVPPPRPVNAEQLWLDSFKRNYCGSIRKEDSANSGDEPPLRVLRLRVAQTQKLVEQLKMAAMDVIAIEKRLESMTSTCETNETTLGVEIPRLRVQRERKLAGCEALKRQLEEMNAVSGLLSEKQGNEIRAFAARVKKKKAYRKRAKLQRRVEASIRRAVGTLERVESTGENNTEPMRQGLSEEEQKDPPPLHKTGFLEGRMNCLSTPKSESTSLKQTLDPETLTIGALIAVRRAWDSYIVFPHTPGASTIPPHFIPPPQMPSTQWAVFVNSSANSSDAGKLCQ